MNPSPFLDHTPYDIMVGTWIGTAVTFTPTGERVSAGASRNIIYWKTRPNLMHFRQDQDLGALAKIGEPAEEDRIKALLGEFAPVAIRNLALPDYDLIVNGKQATATSKTIDLAGTETRPDVYHFELKEKGTGLRLRWYNSHIFTNPNERQIMGPVVDTNTLLGLIMVQIFTRISYDVPTALQRDLT